VNTFNYAFLIKDKAGYGLVKKLIKLKKYIVFGVFVILFFNCALLLSIDKNGIKAGTVILSVVLGIFNIAVIAAFIGYPIFLSTYFWRLTAAQEPALNPDDETDRIFLTLTKKYRELRKKDLKRTLIAMGVIAAAFVVLILIITLGGAEASLENAGIWIFAAVLAAVTIGVSLKSVYAQMKFIKESVNEIGILQNFQYSREGLTKEEIDKKKLSPFDMSDSQKMTDYLYPTPEIQKKMTSANKYVAIVGALGGIALCIGFFVLVAAALMSGNFFPVSLYSAILATGIVALLVLSDKKLLKYQKLQAAEFQKNPEYFRYHLELYAEMKKNQRINRTVQIIALAVWVAASVVAAFFKGPAFLIALIAGMVFAAVAVNAAALITYPKYRKRAKPIEIKIDGHLKGTDGEESGTSL
jgi:hypothetical protein